MLEQFGPLRGVNQCHVPLAHAHGEQQFVRNLVFGIDQGVANGVKVVVGHMQCSLKTQEFNGIALPAGS